MLHRALLLLTVLLFAAPMPALAKTRELNDYGKLIRPRDAEAIVRIPKNILSDDELRKYLQQVSVKVEEVLSPQSKKDSGLIIEGVRRSYPTAAAQAAAANGCVVAGRLKEALLIMGKVCQEDASNPDNLNNYAAFLTMAGGGNAAVPILAKLNQQFPNNSTVLNNLGQAWFGLGDLEEAKKHLDAAIRIFPHHPQANYTKSVIEGSRGNKTAAIAALKASLQSTFSEARANRLEKLGGTIDFQADFGFHMPEDALGLSKFVIPPFPKSTDALEDAFDQWETFRKQCHQGADKLSARIQRLDKELAEKNEARQKRMQAVMQTMDPVALAQFAREEKQNAPPFMRKALAKLVMMEEDGESRIRKMMAMNERLTEVTAQTSKLKGEWQADTEAAYEQMQKDGVEYSVAVGKVHSLFDKYLPAINRLWEEYNTAYVDHLRKTTNSQAYFGQYMTPGGDLAVEAMETRLKRDFLSELAGLNVAFWEVEHDCGGFIPEEGGPPDSSSAKKKKKSSAGQLQDFYDVHCDHKYNFSFPGMGTIDVACNKMTTEFTGLPGLEAKWTDNLDTNQLINGTVMIGGSLGTRSKEIGPLTLEVEASGGMFMDFDSNGITDVGPYGEIKGEIGAVEAGAEARYGWNSGFSGKGAGILDGLSF